MFRTLTTSLAALILATPLAAAPLAAFAQDVPSYAQSADEAPGDQQLRGRITDFDGGYNLTVRDERGYIDNVALHPGTIINPTGLTLAPGMTVSILGYNEGDAFAANEIDTPYTYSSGVPFYSGHPWNYYGSGFSLAFFFGNPGWWHGDDFHGGYRYYRGARYYDDVRIRNVYNYNGGGGSFRGRAFVAPATHGGYYRATVRVESGMSTQRSVTHFAGPPIVHGYSHPQTVDYSHVQSRTDVRPQYHNEAGPQYHSEARPQYQSEPRPQYHNEPRPQYHSEPGPQYHNEAPAQNRGAAHSESHSESHAREPGHAH